MDFQTIICDHPGDHDRHAWTERETGNKYECFGTTPLPGFGQPEQTEPAVSEVDRLKGLLERRTEALNRTVKELEAERVKVARVEELARRLDLNGGVASGKAIRNTLAGLPIYAPEGGWGRAK